MRSVTRPFLIGLLVAIAALVAFSLLTGAPWSRYTPSRERSVFGTSGIIDPAVVDRIDKVRAKGAEVSERVGETAAKVHETVAEAAMTSKIKAKMVLDDHVKARAIDVTTTGSTVTLTGIVRSVDEHDRAYRLARETDGVTQVVDHLFVQE